MLHIGIAIALLVLCSSYKSCPIVSKLTGIKVLTIILTVLASIKLMSFLFGERKLLPHSVSVRFKCLCNNRDILLRRYHSECHRLYQGIQVYEQQ